MPRVTIFVADPERPGAIAQTAIARAQAAARRAPGPVEVAVLALDGEQALQLGASLEPTIAVDDLIVAVGQAPAAGHLLRALATAGGDTA